MTPYAEQENKRLNDWCYVCSDCGSEVWNKDLHSYWHTRLVTRMERPAERVPQWAPDQWAPGIRCPETLMTPNGFVNRCVYSTYRHPPSHATEPLAGDPAGVWTWTG